MASQDSCEVCVVPTGRGRHRQFEFAFLRPPSVEKEHRLHGIIEEHDEMMAVELPLETDHVVEMMCQRNAKAPSL